MQVRIKSFDVGKIEVKTNGTEFEVYSPNGEEHLGDLILTKTKLIWCNRRVRRENGNEITWNEFIEWANSATRDAFNKG